MTGGRGSATGRNLACAAGSWAPFPARPTLNERDVHVLRVPLTPSDFLREAELLSPDERSRASRFAFDLHRRRFVAGRAALRRIVAVYLGTEPSRLAFSYSERGRPSLAFPKAPAFDFNLAHSEDLAVFAACRHRVGVDVEHLRPLSDAPRIVRRFFSPREAAEWMGLPSEMQARAFLSAWTRKEALLKASGLGLGALHEVEVALKPDAPPAVLSAPGGVPRWCLLDVEPAAGFVAAVAVDGPVAVLHTWDWSWP